MSDNRMLDGHTPEGRKAILMLARMGHQLEFSYNGQGHWRISRLGAHSKYDPETDRTGAAQAFYRIKETK